jgi:nucleotide-binding universal stress UspA family protein
VGGPKTERDELEAIVKETAGAAQIESAKPDHAGTGVDVTSRLKLEAPERAIAAEARKGFGLLIVGVEPEEKIGGIMAAFDGPVAIAIARGRHQREPAEDSDLSVLVPVTGTERSRRGAEIGLALARASLGSVTALHVARRRRPHGLRRFHPGWDAFGDNAAAILQEAVRLGDQFGVPIRTAVRTQVAAETAILTQLEEVGYDLVVMGVSSRPGTTLSFGDAAAAVLERSGRSILFVTS